jgi:hypothetical protein
MHRRAPMDDSGHKADATKRCGEARGRFRCWMKGGCWAVRPLEPAFAPTADGSAPRRFPVRTNTARPIGGYLVRSKRDRPVAPLWAAVAFCVARWWGPPRPRSACRSPAASSRFQPDDAWTIRELPAALDFAFGSPAALLLFGRRRHTWLGFRLWVRVLFRRRWWFRNRLRNRRLWNLSAHR